jgi:hypothetical protein
MVEVVKKVGFEGWWGCSGGLVLMRALGRVGGTVQEGSFVEE